MTRPVSCPLLLLTFVTAISGVSFGFGAIYQTWNPDNCDFYVMDASKGSNEWKFFKDYVLTKGPQMNMASL